MKRYLFLTTFLCLLFFKSVFSIPVWEISSRWSCVQILHSAFTEDGKIKSINKTQYKSSSIIDFENSQIINIFSNGDRFYGKIISKSYLNNPDYNNESIFVIDWENNPVRRTSKIVESMQNEFWWSTTSYGDKEIWSSHSKCNPI